jgi:hypothetical protein
MLPQSNSSLCEEARTGYIINCIFLNIELHALRSTYFCISFDSHNIHIDDNFEYEDDYRERNS